MKNLMLLIAFLSAGSLVQAQVRKDGAPNLRYRSNRQTDGNRYSPRPNGTTNPPTEYQTGYERHGTRVDGSYHTKSNDTNLDNWTTEGNTNPLTGNRGTRARDYSNDAYNYGRGQVIQTGPRGGQYYESSTGNRTYVPKRQF